MPKINQEEYEVLKELDDKWKWIARDYPANLFVYKERPKKFEGTQSWDDLKDNCAYFRNDLFQFIQWEDEEPHNIQELIVDYEYSAEHVSHVINERVKALGNAWSESEETEVKDKRWALKEAKETIDSFFNRSSTGVAKHYEDELIAKIADILNQLDEPEVLSQEITYEDALKVIAENIDTDEFSIGLYLEALSNNEKYGFLTEKWIEDNTSSVDDEGRLYVWKNDLEKAIVPKQEEVDQAYKDGYEKGKEHATEKGKEHATEKEKETVASVFVDFLIASAKLKLALGMEVEELEE